MPLAGPGTPVGFRAGGGATTIAVQGLGVAVKADVNVGVAVAATTVAVTVSPPSIIASG